MTALMRLASGEARPVTSTSICDIDLLPCQVHVTRTLQHPRTGGIVSKAPESAKGRAWYAFTFRYPATARAPGQARGTADNAGDTAKG